MSGPQIPKPHMPKPPITEPRISEPAIKLTETEASGGVKLKILRYMLIASFGLTVIALVTVVLWYR